MAEEYFIRGPSEDTARGPYTMDALVTLAEAGQLTRDHYFFDQGQESWVQIGSNPDLTAQVFPEKKALTLRKKSAEEIQSLNQSETGEEAVRIEDVLAAAEGFTEDTRHVRTSREWRNRTASVSIPVIGTMLLVSALSVLYPSWDILSAILDKQEGSLALLFQRPVVILGALDLLLGALLLLNATEIFPLIRFRAMLGTGFFFIVYAANWTNGDPSGFWMAVAVLAFGLGLYICTLTLHFPTMVAAATIGIAGALGLVWFQNILPLLPS